MEDKESEETWAIMQERLRELMILGVAFDGRDNPPSRLWLAECAAAIGMGLAQLSTTKQAASLVGLAAAMWQAGYEAAPKLEFVLPEGDVG